MIRRLLSVLRDPVAWILVIAGIVEMISGGTAARGAVLFAAAGLILADRVRLSRGRPVSPVAARMLQQVLAPRWWPLLLVAVGVAVALLREHTLPLTLIVGSIGIALVGWAWLTGPGSDTATPSPGRSLWWWGGLFLVLGLWELTALLGQPTLAVYSSDHPTISFLVEPIIATFPGRAVAIGLWAVAGRGLVRRA
jgi:hypothetical protein